MVKGLDLFQTHFAAYENRYVLIGGTASFLALDEAGIDFRATKDLDVVLCIEAFDAEFAKAVWAFVQLAGYQIQQKASGKKVFYRFQKPSDERYPSMLELFSRAPDAVLLDEAADLTPIPVDDEVESLSAILLDDDYYRFIQSGKRNIAGLPCVDGPHLIPLKAHAWLDLTRRADGGEKIDSSKIKKHRSDVARLYPLLVLDDIVSLPKAVKLHLAEFVKQMEKDTYFDTRPYTNGIAKTELIAGLRKVYAL